jgi:hypothetical protein
MASEALLDTRYDRARRTHGQLLSGNLEDECSKRVKRRQLVHPRAGPEARTGVDQAREHRIGLPQKGPCLDVGNSAAFMP